MILCGDVLFEVIQFGNRRQLTKVERVGRRIYRLINASLGESPFLVLNLRLATGFCLELFSLKIAFILKFMIKIGSLSPL